MGCRPRASFFSLGKTPSGREGECLERSLGEFGGGVHVFIRYLPLDGNVFF